MREELINKILQSLISHGCLYDGAQMELAIILKDYEIEGRRTELAIVNEDLNQSLVKKFLVAKTVRNCTKRTLEYYKACIDKFLMFVQKDIPDITADDIRLYMAVRLKKDGVSEVTVNSERRSLGSFFGWLYTEELIRHNPMAKIDRIKERKQKKEAFTEYEIELLRAACRSGMETAMVEIFLSTGCRVGELVLMKRSELNGERIVVHGKGNKDRTVYLNAKATLALRKYLGERSDNSDYIFPKATPPVKASGKARAKCMNSDWYKNPELIIEGHRDISSTENTIRNIGKRAGVPHTHPHRFRRTCATLALRRGMPIEQVSKMLGHEEIATTQIYLDLSEADLETAHRKFVS